MTIQVYREDEGMTLFHNDGSVTRLTTEETEILDRFANNFDKHHRVDVPTRAFEIAQIFPESKKKYLLPRKKEIVQELQALLEYDLRINERFSAFSQKDTCDSLLLQNEIKREELLEEQARNKEMLDFMGTRTGRQVRDFSMELERAKSYPIDRLIKFTRLKAKCIWHNDNNPSMHYYKKKNKVYCFSCKKGGDVFDVVMQLNNCNLKEAISFLNGE